jgi:hypothetical protein
MGTVFSPRKFLRPRLAGRAFFGFPSLSLLATAKCTFFTLSLMYEIFTSCRKLWIDNLVIIRVNSNSSTWKFIKYLKKVLNSGKQSEPSNDASAFASIFSISENGKL